MTRLVKKVKDAGIAAKAEFRDRTRSVKKRILNIVKFTKNRTNEAKENVHKTVKELVKITRDVLSQPARFLAWQRMK